MKFMVLDKYALDYLTKYPVLNNYVTSYISPNNSPNRYLIVLYKMERCPKEKVGGFTSINIDECINSIRESQNINKNILVEILYIIRAYSAPSIIFNLYHPDSGEKLELTSCAGFSLTFKSSLFNNKDIDVELVKFFASLDIVLLWI